MAYLHFRTNFKNARQLLRMKSVLSLPSFTTHLHTGYMYMKERSTLTRLKTKDRNRIDIENHTHCTVTHFMFEVNKNYEEEPALMSLYTKWPEQHMATHFIYTHSTNLFILHNL